MKIERHNIREFTIEEFAEKYGLTMVIRERIEPSSDNMRFYAAFKGVDVRGSGTLSGVFGNGETERAAIENYIPKISCAPLVYGATSSNRVDLPPAKIIGDDR